MAEKARPKRADARRNEKTLLDAAAAVFVASGVDAPVRDIAAKAGVGMGTIYRHFPTRADLIIAVYRHQVEACAEAGPYLLASSESPHVALARWIDRCSRSTQSSRALRLVFQQPLVIARREHTRFPARRHGLSE